MIAVIAALSRELAGLTRGLRADAVLLQHGIHRYRRPDCILVCAGMGAARVGLAVGTALDAGARQLFSVGLAGACQPGLEPGTVLQAGTVVDTSTGERWATQSASGPVLATSHTIATVQEKSRLYKTYGAALVDMEAATVARLAAAHGVPFRAIKAVSDAHDFELESLGRFTSSKGQFRTGAFALHTALRPHRWRHTVQLGRGSQRGLRELTLKLEKLLKA